MGKKDKRKYQERDKAGQEAGRGQGPDDPAAPSQESAMDPKYYTWGWYGKILLGCILFSTVLYFVSVGVMRTISQHYTDEGIAMYRRAMTLKSMGTPEPDTIVGELSALDAIADVEKLKIVLLRDIAYTRAPITEETKSWLKSQDEKYGELQAHLRDISLTDPIQATIREKTIDKVEGIRECIREVLKNVDMKDRDQFQKMAVRLTRKIGGYSWYTQIGAGFFSWPAALDAAEHSFFEALRFNQRNQAAAYWWGEILMETAIEDVAAEKKIMAIKFSPDSELADTILAEFKTAADEAPGSPRAMYNYAFALYRKGRVDEALPIYKKIHSGDPDMNTFEGFLAKRRIDIIERGIDMRWYKTDDF